ncbi:MAG TPA: hypothetical protein PKN04_04580 [bacterium]|nr:hypothetical protein [bacterium]HNT65036.1 hypothetical protein [bacterium]HOX84443.1 hypothetical protein [bacterium]HPG45960.1 hypothetical protein [bacterium]HPM97782.1 hypothetical protein [bacterium]
MLRSLNCDSRVICLLLAIVLAPILPAQQESDLSRYLPPADFAPHWMIDFAPETYERQNLFEVINGEADLYLAYGFERLSTVAYIDSTNDRHSLSVDLFCMDSPLHAFGIYSAYRNPDYRFIDLGLQGYLSDYSLRFVQERYVVQINAGSSDSTMQTIMVKIARLISESLPTPNEPIRELDLLPREGQMPNTLKLISDGFLGRSLFGPTLQAHYITADQDTVMAFVAMQKDSTEAADALAAFAREVQNGDGSEGQELDRDCQVVCGNLFYLGEILSMRHDHYLFGVMRFGQKERGLLVLQQLQRHIEQQIR